MMHSPASESKSHYSMTPKLSRSPLIENVIANYAYAVSVGKRGYQAAFSTQAPEILVRDYYSYERYYGDEQGGRRAG